jgi:protein O-mannosyl-transferase
MTMRVRVLSIVAIVLVTVVAFSDLRQHEFINCDDENLIVGNPYVHSLTWVNLKYLWTHPTLRMYMPVTNTAWVILAQYSRTGPGTSTELPTLNAGNFHLFNLFVHCLNALLVWILLRRLLGHDWAAVCGALLFAIHPVQVEPVAWATGLKDILSATFTLVALWQFVDFLQSEGRKRAWHWAWATLAFIVAVLAKPLAVSTPVIAWVLACAGLQRPWREVTRAVVPWLVLALPVVLIARAAQPLAGLYSPLWGRPLIAGDALAFYLGKTFWPTPLYLDYGRSPEVALHHWWIYVTWLAPVLVGALVWLGRRQRPELLAAGGLFLAPLLPVLGLLPFSYQGYSTVADRYLYLALLGPALALGWLVRRSQRIWIDAIVVAVLLLLAFQTSVQVLYWRDSVTLSVHTIEHNPRSSLASNNLWTALSDRGQQEEGLNYLRAALKADPDAVGTRLDLANNLASRGHLAEAEQNVRQVLANHPEAKQAHLRLGVILHQMGRRDEAEQELKIALRMAPGLLEGWLELGLLEHEKGDIAQTEACFQHAVSLAPSSIDARNYLAGALAVQGKLAEAEAQYRQTLQIDAGDPSSHFNLSQILDVEGKHEEAKRERETAFQLDPSLREKTSKEAPKSP